MKDELIADDGTREGQKIPDSRCYRSWCPVCEEPMRVQHRWEVGQECESCERGANVRVHEANHEPHRAVDMDDGWESWQEMVKLGLSLKRGTRS